MDDSSSTSYSTPRLHPQSHGPPAPQSQIHPAHTPPVKRESNPPMQHQIKDSPSMDDSMPSASEFVKKLYKMLEDPSFQSVVSWGPQGDCFVVKDMNEFTKSILPRMFKHSNFASFVRQLNKYDFHKVKNTDDNQFGEHSWTFRHPDFHAERRDALENIKRKVPAQRLKASSSQPSSSSHHHTHQSPSTTRPLSPSPPYAHQAIEQHTSLLQSHTSQLQHHGSLLQNHSTQLQTLSLSVQSLPPSQHDAQLQTQVRRLSQENKDLSNRLADLERKYDEVLGEMVNWQRGMAQQDSLMQSLVGWVVGGQQGQPPLQNVKPPSSNPPPSSSQPGSSSTPTSRTHPLVNPTNPPGRSDTHLSAADINIPNNNNSSGNANSASGNNTTLTQSPLSASDQNPFLPARAAQRMMGKMVYPETDVGRATLMQMSEMSRRGAVGMDLLGGAPP
ncbi:HSF-type DNA-binding-domain-containing protein, partial [Infundibulicybe gibba]